MMKIKIIILITFTCILFLTGCATTVKLTLKNMENFAQDPAIIKGGQEQQLSTIPAYNQINRTEQLNYGESLQVISRKSNSAIIFSSNPITGNFFGGTVDYPIELKKSVEGKGILDDSKSLTTLSKSFKTLGDDIGAEPIPLDIALKTRIGALVIAYPPTASKSPSVIVTPGQLGVKIMTLEEVGHYPTMESESVDFSGTTLVNIETAIPMISKFGVTFDNNQVYNLRWDLKGFGQIAKTEDDSKNYIKQFNTLDSQIVANIKNILKKNPNAKLYYINNFYVLDNATLHIKQAHKLSIKDTIDANTILTTNGAYSFTAATEDFKSYGPVVLNYWGNELALEESTTIKLLNNASPIKSQQSSVLMTTTNKNITITKIKPINNKLVEIHFSK